MGERLLHQFFRVVIGLEDILQVSEFRLFGGGVANAVGPVPHTSEHSCGGPLVHGGGNQGMLVCSPHAQW